MKANLDKKPAKAVYLWVYIFVIIAALVVYFLVGFAPSKDHANYRSYSTLLAVDPKEDALAALFEDVRQAVGTPVSVYTKLDGNSGGTVLVIDTIPAADIDEEAVVKMLNEKYADFEVESLTNNYYNAMIQTAPIGSYFIIYLFLLIVIGIVSVFILELRDGLFALLMILMDTFATFSIYVLCRVPHFRLLIAGLLVTLVVAPVLHILQMKNCRDKMLVSKKRDSELVVAEVGKQNRVFSFDFLIVTVFLLLGLCVVGFVVKNYSLVYCSVVIFASIAVAIFSSTFITPALWNKMNRK